MSDKTVITAKDLSKRFGDFTAVNTISFDVRQGEIFGFLGANGAGKTTAIKMLCGLSKPTSGEASIAGFDIYKQTEEIKKHIGYMSQHFSLYQDLTIRENIRFYAGIYGLKARQIKERSIELISDLGLDDYTDRFVKELPLGWKQKLAFSIAVIHNPSIVFLDEPTSGVDPITRRQFWGLIYEAAAKGITIFVTTHYLEEAEYCDRVSIMVDGLMHDLDSPKALMEKYNKPTMNDVFLQIAIRNSRKEK
ncbi:MAG: ABC transporter ATP-binding protein [Bacteroidetes bacterium]|nr:ABC transporter ATP-binding protein [Bacteroidota bacterium]MDA1121291.1 ABC transporter ATP-binding protein [Bacteroidota bacterium]